VPPDGGILPRPAGITRWQLARAIAAGLLVHAGRGTYSLPGIQSDYLEAVRVNGYLSHASAAEAWGLDLISPPSVPHIAVPHNRPAPHIKAVLHRIRSDELVETAHNPWPVTTIERTLVDCARTMPFADALAIADSALRRRLVDWHVLTRLAEDVRGPGASAVRRALLAADGRSASIGESLTRAAALDAGLPPPELQYKLQLPGGRLAYLDLAWRRYGGRVVRLGVEFDGRSSHGSDGAFVADRRRRNRIETIGWGLLEITMIHVRREYTQTGALILATLNGRWRDAH
jgi:hypothetical protein